MSILKTAGRFLGRINTYIILSVIFIFIITPIALIKKLFSGKKPAVRTTWTETEISELERQF